MDYVIRQTGRLRLKNSRSGKGMQKTHSSYQRELKPVCLNNKVHLYSKKERYNKSSIESLSLLTN